jgi:hypothetical protein
MQLADMLASKASSSRFESEREYQLGALAQSADAVALRATQSEFESRVRYQYWGMNAKWKAD